MAQRREKAGGTGEGSGARMRTFQPHPDDGCPRWIKVLPALPCRQHLNWERPLASAGPDRAPTSSTARRSRFLHLVHQLFVVDPNKHYILAGLRETETESDTRQFHSVSEYEDEELVYLYDPPNIQMRPERPRNRSNEGTK
jgi:hypothetical protein